MWHLYLVHIKANPRKLFKANLNIRQFRTDLSSNNNYVIIAPMQIVGLQQS